MGADEGEVEGEPPECGLATGPPREIAHTTEAVRTTVLAGGPLVKRTPLRSRFGQELEGRTEQRRTVSGQEHEESFGDL